MTKAEKAELRAQARRDYLEGMSYRQIAAKYGVGIGSVSRWAEKDRWDPIDRNRNGTPKRNAGTERNGTEEPQEAAQEQTDSELPWDYDLLRETALRVLARINERLQAAKPLEPRDIKSLTGALLDLKNQLNALSPRELREQAARLRSLERQSEEQTTEPVQVVFVNREWDNADT